MGKFSPGLDPKWGHLGGAIGERRGWEGGFIKRRPGPTYERKGFGATPYCKHLKKSGFGGFCTPARHEKTKGPAKSR